MNKIKNLNGIVGVMNTPFGEDGLADPEGIRWYVDYVAGCGGVGILVTAMAAEVNKLSVDERKMIVETAVEAMNGRLPVIGGASAGGGLDAFEMAALYDNLGCDAILVNIPYSTPHEFILTIQKIAALTNKPLVVQDWDFEGMGIPVEVIKEMHEKIMNFESLKVEVKPAGVKYSAVINASGGKLNVSGGWASSQMIEALDRGVNVFMSTVFTDIYVEIYRLHHDGRRSEAIDLFNRFLPVIAFYHQHIDISIHFNKLVNYRLGLFPTPKVREPILRFDKYHQRIAEELIDYAKTISEDIKRLKSSS